MNAMTIVWMALIAGVAIAFILAIEFNKRGANRRKRWSILKAVIGAFAIVALPVVALDSKDAEANASVCETLKPAAAATMHARQVGAPASDLLENVDEFSAKYGNVSQFATREPLAELDRVLRELIVEAYERPRYETRSLQQRAANDFGEEKYRLCVKDRWYSIPPLWLRAVFAQVASAWE